jgi:hypothetical protein
MDHAKEKEKLAHEIFKMLDGVPFNICIETLSIIISYIFESCGPNDEEIKKVFDIFIEKTKKNRKKMKEIIKNMSSDDGKSTLLQR